MLFQSYGFIFFFCAVYFIFFVSSRKKPKLVPLVLLISSYYFYASWNPYYLSLIVLSTILDFYLGHKIHVSFEDGRRKLYLLFSIGLNLSLLFFFKYFNFVSNSFELLFLSAFGTKINLPDSRFLLPVGISFYTFQTMSYSIDIYRKEIKPVRNIFSFATYVAFFPQLVAGPIIRAKDFFPYLEGLSM